MVSVSSSGSDVVVHEGGGRQRERETTRERGGQTQPMLVRGRRQARQEALILCLCLAAVWLPYLPHIVAPDAAGHLTESDVPALRSRLQVALERYSSDEAETMDCEYPNRK